MASTDHRVAQLIAEAQRSRLSRRSVLRRGLALGLSAPAIAGVLAAHYPVTHSAAAQTAAADEAVAIETEVVFAMPSEPSSLDPHMIRGNEEWNALFHIYEPIINRTPEGEPIPGLLLGWEAVDEGNRTWRLKLREGVTFHNGEPWNAEVLKYNFERIRTNEAVTVQQHINGIDSEQVIDEYTLDISLSTPMTLLENGFLQVGVVPMKYTQEVGDAGLAEKPVGTGPYEFVEWKKDEHIRIEAYADYWGGVPSVRKGLIRAILEPPARVAALVSGEVQVIRGVSVYDVERIEANEGSQAAIRPGPRVWNLKMDTSRATGSPGIEGDNPFVKREVREAVYRAINIHELIDSALQGYGEPAGQLSAPFVFGHNPQVERLAYDADLARQLLSDARFADGFSVRFDVDANQAIIGEAIAGYLSEVGINAELNAVATSVYRDLTNNNETSLVLGSWGGTMVNSTFDANIHTIDAEAGFGRANAGMYSNPELDKLIDQARQTFDREEQERTYQELQRLAMEDVAVVPLYFESIIVGASSDLNVVPRFNEWVMLQDVTPTQ